MNRCQIVANGLLEALRKGNNSAPTRIREILQQFAWLGIEIDRAYLNANSEDIYNPLKDKANISFDIKPSPSKRAQ